MSPDSVSPGSVSPDSVSPGSVSPGSVSPGSVSPGSASPSRAGQQFNVGRFAELRAGRGLGWGAPLVYSTQTGSTNDDALAAARAGAAHGSVFFADHQTQGRGRRGKTWVAAAGQHLLFSILLRDVQPRTDADSVGDPSIVRETGTGVGALTLVVGLGVRAALAAQEGVGLAAPLGLKWPNDVLAGSRKLAGILCEGQFVGSRLEAVVIGVGINVFRASYPPELEQQVACLEGLAASSTLERERLLVDVLTAIEHRFTSYRDAGFRALLDEFTQHDALAEARVEISGAAPIVGIARGVDAGGRLLLESDGMMVPVLSGTVRVL